jgi:hypothetical protein
VGKRDKRNRKKKKILRRNIKRRNTEVLKMIVNPNRNAGPHQNRDHDIQKGSTRKQKHKEDLEPLS